MPVQTNRRVERRLQRRYYLLPLLKTRAYAGTQFLKLSVFVTFESRKDRNQSRIFAPQPDTLEACLHSLGKPRIINEYTCAFNKKLEVSEIFIINPYISSEIYGLIPIMFLCRKAGWQVGRERL